MFRAFIPRGLTAARSGTHLNLGVHQGTISSQKQEMLFSRFGLNYNTVDPMYKKGSIVMWEDESRVEAPDASVGVR